ncbi:hypothetical protein R3W88_013650 [Solanum pinnatisectum]|uniref:F-box associated beta-propeller type 3 domain-containing protein n=1 Tax=Solanum pinnatisectum TaxID=50273 RepID=A0AAV9KPI9_9SOLN|nr:hypothetical protein R3W88_013650 [Solanum pinnatisectum]
MKVQQTKTLKTRKPFCSKEVIVMDIKSSSCKRRRISHVTKMRIMDLPLTVCKLWYKLLSYDPLFVSMYQTRSLKFPCIYLIDGVGKPSLLKLKAEYNYYVHHCNRPIQLTIKFHYPLGRMFLVGLCNGLTCFVNGPTHIEKHSVYISNPLLGEYFELKLPQWETSVCCVTNGFCFSKASGKYKVLRLVVREITNLSEFEAYTLGVGEKWRNVGKIPSKKMTSFTPSILRQKMSSPCQLHRDW